MSRLYLCNSTDSSWALIELSYTGECTLEEYKFLDSYHMPLILFYIYFISYYIFIFFLLPLFIFVLYLWLKQKFQRFVSPEGDALITRHPDGYWANAVAENAPFGQFLRRLRN